MPCKETDLISFPPPQANKTPDVSTNSMPRTKNLKFFIFYLAIIIFYVTHFLRFYVTKIIITRGGDFKSSNFATVPKNFLNIFSADFVGFFLFFLFIFYICFIFFVFYLLFYYFLIFSYFFIFFLKTANCETVA